MEGARVEQADVELVRIEGGRLSDLYRLYADGATRLAYLITGDRALAEDLVQDAFVKLAGRLLHLRDSGGFEAYLRRTVVNLANSHFRRRKRFGLTFADPEEWWRWAWSHGYRGVLEAMSPGQLEQYREACFRELRGMAASGDIRGRLEVVLATARRRGYGPAG